MSLALLVALPPLLALVGYYRAQIAGAPLPRPGGDATFYAYQLMRAAECHGQWWRIAEDPRLGQPYPSQFAKHPGLFEGVDLMLCAALFAGYLSAAWTYHLAVLLTLTFNGWIAACIVVRSTRSVVWAAMAVALVTLNEPVGMRMLGHLHLFKFGWAMLAVWAFVSYLKQPAWWRGLLLGLAVALTLQGSFYLGFFTGLGLAFWYGLEAIVGRVGPRHRGATIMAAAVFIFAAALTCFPVWSNYSPVVGSDQYYRRSWSETWVYGSELWKYVVPKCSPLGESYFRDLRHKIPAPDMDEGWSFLGYTVLLAIVVAAVALLRKAPLARKLNSFVLVSLGLMAFWMLLSLAGGPSALVFYAAPSFRCYGRAGLLAVALGSVVAPIVLYELVRSRSRAWLRVALTLVFFAVAAWDTARNAMSFNGWPTEHGIPAWVEWVNQQPADTRLAVFMTHPPNPKSPQETTSENEPFYWWGVSTLEWLPEHKRATLCGADFALFEGDLRLLGATYDQMNPSGLRFVASLGYETFAFHQDYLATNSWISRVPWLDNIEKRGEWQFYRSNPSLLPLPTTSFAKLLAESGNDLQPRTAPPGCWITGALAVEQDTIVAGNEWAFLAWTDERGRLLSAPQPALYQHVFGPEIPAYTIRTPSQAGSYRLAVFDQKRRPLTTIDYRIDPGLIMSQPRYPAQRPGVTIHPISVKNSQPWDQGSTWDVTLTNTCSVYIQAKVFREHLSAVSRTHPGLLSPWLKANDGAMVLSCAPVSETGSSGDSAREIPLPQDLAPGERLRFKIPTDRLPPSWANHALRIEPCFTGVGSTTAPPANADLKIVIDETAAGIARKPPATESRVR
jgi:hypothetical protein